MSWKVTVGTKDKPTYIGKRYIKKHYSNSQRISKNRHTYTNCSGDIYSLGKIKIPEEDKPKDVWVCMDSGELLFNAPPIKKGAVISKPKPKPVKKVSPKPKAVPKPKPKPITPKPVEKPKVETPKVEKSVPEIKYSGKSISEVKGIGAKAQEQLVAVNIKTVDELLAKDANEIAQLLGRKSTTMIEKWLVNAKEL